MWSYRNTTAGTEARKKAVEDLNKTYPDYLSNIDLEKAGIDEINKSHMVSIRLMRAQFAEKMKAAQLDKELQPILKELTDIQVEMKIIK